MTKKNRYKKSLLIKNGNVVSILSDHEREGKEKVRICWF